MTLVEKMLKRSDAVIQMQRLQQAIKEENARRKDFYKWVTEDFKAEFINGEIVVHSPVKRRHWKTSSLLSRLLDLYVSLNKLGDIGTEKVMISLTRNDYEPDLVFFSQEKVDTFTDDQVLFPAPNFIVEILSHKTAKHDKTTKKDDYALHGVSEYWIIDPVKQQIEQYILPDSSAFYFPAKTHKRGEIIESKAIEGFKMDVAAVFDEATNLETIQSFLTEK
jgi:Uma2 family endonuclease